MSLPRCPSPIASPSWWRPVAARMLLTTFTVCVVLSSSGQMQTGESMKDFREVFGLTDGPADVRVTLIRTLSPGCIVFAGEQPELTFQFENTGAHALKANGRVEVIRYATQGIPGDIWLPQVVKLEDLKAVPLSLDLAAGAWVDITLRPVLPETKGGYGLVLDLGTGHRQFLAGLVRTFAPPAERIQYPHQSLDEMDPSVLERLGIQAVRFGWPYIHSANPEYGRKLEELAGDMRTMHDHNVTVALEFGAGWHPNPIPPLPRTHLNDEGVLIGGKGDMAWMPQDDKDFEDYVTRILAAHGWPKGPVTAVMLWNEPWEGLSISGWGADMTRYRTIYRHLGQAVDRARREAGVDVLIGGCDSSSNTWDKLFPDGSDAFMPYYDFCSIHYQGMSAPTLYRAWRERTQNKGRVLIWDTESWVANTDDRIAGIVASNRAAGYDRALGVYFGNISTQLSHHRVQRDTIRTADGPREQIRPLWSWPPAASVGAVQHFIGERPFREILFRRGLPWVYVFDGLHGNADDGTLVVIGDIGELFANPDGMLFRNVRPLTELRENAALRRRLAALPDGVPERLALEAESRSKRPFAGVTLSLPRAGGTFGLYDFYGNPAPTPDGMITVPLDARGFFLRADPNSPGSFAALIEAVRSGRIDGLQPVELILHDMQSRIVADVGARITVTVTNVLNRQVSGSLQVTVGGKDASQKLQLAPHTTRQLTVAVRGVIPSSDNRYPSRVLFVADDPGDGFAELHETLHVNLIQNRTITVDGKLDDWEGALPHTVSGSGAASQTITEAAWLPFRAFAAGTGASIATAYLAYDNAHFYFAMKTADDTPWPGTLRFAERDDDAFFYPEVCFTEKDGERTPHTWPAGVRRYSYRRDPTLPDGNTSRFDNVQIAFNAIPFDEEEDWITQLPGRMPRFSMFKCTDYEYALNTVAPEYGGGVEVWRLLVPGMTRKHFYPRQPKHPLEGAVKGARLATVYVAGTRITELALPWSEIPHVRALMTSGQPVKFSFRVNHDSGGPLLECAKDRSVSRINAPAFHPDWKESWANEVEFAWER